MELKNERILREREKFVLPEPFFGGFSQEYLQDSEFIDMDTKARQDF